MKKVTFLENITEKLTCDEIEILTSTVTQKRRTFPKIE